MNEAIVLAFIKTIVESLLYVLQFHIYPQKEKTVLENIKSIFPQVAKIFKLLKRVNQTIKFTGICPAYTTEVCKEFQHSGFL